MHQVPLKYTLNRVKASLEIWPCCDLDHVWVKMELVHLPVTGQFLRNPTNTCSWWYGTYGWIDGKNYRFPANRHNFQPEIQHGLVNTKIKMCIRVQLELVCTALHAHLTTTGNRKRVDRMLAGRSCISQTTCFSAVRVHVVESLGQPGIHARSFVSGDFEEPGFCLSTKICCQFFPKIFGLWTDLFVNRSVCKPQAWLYFISNPSCR